MERRRTRRAWRSRLCSPLHRPGVAALAAFLSLVTQGCSPGGGPTIPTPDPDQASASDIPADGAQPSTHPPEATSAPTETEAPPTEDEPTVGVSPKVIDKAQELSADLSLQEKAGQVVVAAHQGPTAPVDLVVGRHLGGIIVMDPRLSTEQVRDLNATLTQAAEEAGRDWPLFLAVDQEGGLVERAKGELTRFPTFMSYGAADDAELTRNASAASGAELRGIGFTVNFAPEGDVTMGPSDPTIGSRSAGSDPELVARHAVAAAQGYLDAGILPVVKHFPGHGSAPADSHVTLPAQTRSLEKLREIDLVPFAAAVEAGLPAVMVAHLQVDALDSTLPSSMDPEVVQGLLRDDLGFEGLVVTDALNMAAVSDRYDSGEAAVRALDAGADVVLMPPDPVAARDAVEAAVEEGRLDEDRLDEAVVNQLAALLHAEETQTVEPSEPGEARRASRAVSVGALTVVDGPCDGPLVEDGIVPVGDAAPVRRLTSAAERAGLPVGQGTVVELLGHGQQPGGGADVTVAMDTPYVLARSASPVKIALYGDTPGAMVALVDVLTGEADAPGRLPVEVEGVQGQGC